MTISFLDMSEPVTDFFVKKSFLIRFGTLFEIPGAETLKTVYVNIC